MKKLFCIALLWFVFKADDLNKATDFLNRLPQGTDVRITVFKTDGGNAFSNALDMPTYTVIFYNAPAEVK